MFIIYISIIIGLVASLTDPFSLDIQPLFGRPFRSAANSSRDDEPKGIEKQVNLLKAH